MSPLRSLCLLTGLLLTSACATTRPALPPLEAVASADLPRYLGTWCGIASYAQAFRRGCTGTTATYSLMDDGEIEVQNRCRKGSLTGREATALSRARVTDPEANARLEVSFFGPFWGDCWIVDLGAACEYAVVGHPAREYLWILSRASTLEDAVHAGIVQRLAAQGYDPDRLVRTLQ